MLREKVAQVTVDLQVRLLSYELVSTRDVPADVRRQLIGRHRYQTERPPPYMSKSTSLLRAL